NGKDSKHTVHGFPDCFGGVERAKVFHAFAPIAPHHHNAWIFFVHGHSQVRIRFIVAVHDVEPRGEFLIQVYSSWMASCSEATTVHSTAAAVCTMVCVLGGSVLGFTKYELRRERRLLALPT